MHVSLDQNALDALECPICSSPFARSKIFQCRNGHAVCQTCRVRIRTENQNCPSCMEPIGEIRCRPLEHVIDGMRFPCAFVSHGCTKWLRYDERQVHEASCPNGPCKCPFLRCRYSALRLHDHIQTAHATAEAGGGAVVSFVGSAQVTLRRTTQFRVLLHSVDGRVFLLLNGGEVPAGRSLSVVCLGRRPTGGNQMQLQYKLEVSGGGVPGTLSLAASGSVPCVRRLTGHHTTDEGFLLVPDGYWTMHLRQHLR